MHVLSKSEEMRDEKVPRLCSVMYHTVMNMQSNYVRRVMDIYE